MPVYNEQSKDLEYGSKPMTAPFSQYLTTNGLAGGTYSMVVNASLASPATYYVAAAAAADTYVTRLTVVVADLSTSRLSDRFGNISTLANGCVIAHSCADTGVTELSPYIRTNLDLMMACGMEPQVYSPINNLAGHSSGFAAVLDFRRIMPPYGLKLVAGSADRLSLSVRDNLNALDAMFAHVSGFRKYDG